MRPAEVLPDLVFDRVDHPVRLRLELRQELLLQQLQGLRRDRLALDGITHHLEHLRQHRVRVLHPLRVAVEQPRDQITDVVLELGQEDVADAVEQVLRIGQLILDDLDQRLDVPGDDLLRVVKGVLRLLELELVLLDDRRLDLVGVPREGRLELLPQGLEPIGHVLLRQVLVLEDRLALLLELRLQLPQPLLPAGDRLLEHELEAARSLVDLRRRHVQRDLHLRQRRLLALLELLDDLVELDRQRLDEPLALLDGREVGDPDLVLLPVLERLVEHDRVDVDLHPSVPLPRLIVGPRRDGLGVGIASGGDLLLGDPLADEVRLRRRRPVLRELLVASFGVERHVVGVPRQLELLDLRVQREELDGLVEGLAPGLAQRRAGGVELDVLQQDVELRDVLLHQLGAVGEHVQHVGALRLRQDVRVALALGVGERDVALVAPDLVDPPGLIGHPEVLRRDHPQRGVEVDGVEHARPGDLQILLGLRDLRAQLHDDRLEVDHQRPRLLSALHDRLLDLSVGLHLLLDLLLAGVDPVGVAPLELVDELLEPLLDLLDRLVEQVLEDLLADLLGGLDRLLDRLLALIDEGLDRLPCLLDGALDGGLRLLVELREALLDGVGGVGGQLHDAVHEPHHVALDLLAEVLEARLHVVDQRLDLRLGAIDELE